MPAFFISAGPFQGLSRLLSSLGSGDLPHICHNTWHGADVATIRQRGDTWEAQVRKRGWHPIARSFSSKAEAQAWAAVIESEMIRGVFVGTKEAKNKTLGDLLKKYREKISVKKKGSQAEQYRLNALLSDPLAKVKVSDLSGKMLADWRDRRLKAVTGSTTNRDLNLISHVINVARREWGIHVENPVALIYRPPENKARNRRLSRTEEQRLLDALVCPPRDEQGRLTGPSNPWIRPLVIVAIETAMRRSELLSLCWEHVDLELRFVRLLDTKNGEARDVPLSTCAVDTLAALPRDATGRVFPITACDYSAARSFRGRPSRRKYPQRSAVRHCATFGRMPVVWLVKTIANGGGGKNVRTFRTNRLLSEWCGNGTQRVRIPAKIAVFLR